LYKLANKGFGVIFLRKVQFLLFWHLIGQLIRILQQSQEACRKSATCMERLNTVGPNLLIIYA